MANSTINISFDVLALQGASRVQNKAGEDCVLIVLPKSRINAHQNGKCYLSLDVRSNRDGEDKFGKTHSVSESTTKEERQAKNYTPFIGNGKEFVFEGGYKKTDSGARSLPKAAIPENEQDDTSIPF